MRGHPLPGEVTARPARLEVERASLSRDFDGCLSVGLGAPFDALRATDARSSLVARGLERCALDTDLTLDFAESDAGLPTRERLRAVDLPSSFACIVSPHTALEEPQ